MKRLLFKLAEAQVANKNITVKYEGKAVDRRTFQFIKHLKSLGFDAQTKHKQFPEFKFIKCGVGPGAYIGPKYVIKDPYIYDAEPPRKLKCPTKVLRNGWFIQPKCQVFSDLPKEAKRMFLDAGMVHMEGSFYYLTGGGKDGHEDNFGLLDGKLTQFDW
jgi:hypothetical protein